MVFYLFDGHWHCDKISSISIKLTDDCDLLISFTFAEIDTEVKIGILIPNIMYDGKCDNIINGFEYYVIHESRYNISKLNKSNMIVLCDRIMEKAIIHNYNKNYLIYDKSPPKTRKYNSNNHKKHRNKFINNKNKLVTLESGCFVIDWKDFMFTDILPKTNTENIDDVSNYKIYNNIQYDCMSEDDKCDDRGNIVSDGDKYIFTGYFYDKPIINVLERIDEFMRKYFNMLSGLCVNCNSEYKFNIYGLCHRCIDQLDQVIKNMDVIILEINQTIIIMNQKSLNIITTILKEIMKKHVKLRNISSADPVIDTYYRIKYQKHTNVISKILDFILYKNKYVQIHESIFKMDNNQIFHMFMLQNELNLKYNIIKFNNEVKISGMYSYDFWGVIVKSSIVYEFAIEIDDKSHLLPKNTENDKIKNKICSDNNVIIIRIDIANISKQTITYEKILEKYKCIETYFDNL